jgi:mannosyltransferase OCH1-like enzyme
MTILIILIVFIIGVLLVAITLICLLTVSSKKSKRLPSEQITKTSPNNELSADSDPRKIPFRVIRTWKNSHVEHQMFRQSHSKWLDMNEVIAMKWFFDNECEQIFAEFSQPKKQQLLAAYQSLVPGAYKADLWRYCMLYHHGGIYVDSFATPVVSLKEMFTGLENCTFVSALDRVGVHNGFMACKPKHPFVGKAIDMCLQNILSRRYTDHDLGVTGPLLLKRAINACIGNLNLDQDFKAGLHTHQKTGDYYFFKMRPLGKQAMINSENNKIMLYKKYSFFMHAYRKYVSQTGTTYTKLWKQRKIYR